MKYYKITFKITHANNNFLCDSITMQTAQDLIAAFSVDAGLESFENTADGLIGYAQQSLFNEETLKKCIDELPLQEITITYSISKADDKNWNQLWEEQGFVPINIDNKCIIHDSIHTVDNIPKDIINITIDAKQAFGTGTHNTTRMIVKELLNMDLTSKAILDCGCGTGILSIVAGKCNAKEITAYDIDEWSVKNTIHNCNINNIKNIEVIEGTADILHQINKKYNIVIANINRNILLEDMPKFKEVMANDATLILSGFYVNDIPLLKEKAQKLNLRFIKSEEDNQWSMIVLKNGDKA